MSRSRILNLPTTLGALAALAGLAMIVDAELAGGLPPAAVLLVGVGLLALFQGVRVAVGGLRASAKQAALPDVESRRALPTAGDDFDEQLRGVVRGPRWGRAHERAAVRERLERVAVDVLTTYGDCSPEAARRQLDDGTWTDDPQAVALFAPEAARPDDGQALLDRLGQSLSLEPTFNRRVRHAVTALEAYTDDPASASAAAKPDQREVQP